ncbi:alkylphosphocholine resistance protein lem3 [Naganishia albida]|nr:alkylphosphocholine resistance protein lem3 [Naganishia albida]
MGLFQRKKHSENATQIPDESMEEVDGLTPEAAKKPKKKRPANTAFKQQRLKAWQPILTPKSVLPTLLIVGLIFAPIGGVLIWGSNQVTKMTFDYTDCDISAPTDGTSAPMPSNKYSYALSSYESNPGYNAPQWSFSNDSGRAIGQQAQCTITFDVPYDLDPSVFLYYRLTNFYQNNRRYVNSLDSDQLLGKEIKVKDLDDGQCKPITSRDGKPYYPCGLIANSLFNDTYQDITLQNPANGASSQAYEFSEKGITWKNEYKKYTNKPAGNPSDYLPPPNWALRYPDGYTEFPQLASDEHFQVWMKISALPTFTKLWGRNDNDVMQAGTYQVVANMNYPVRMFDGTKSIVISTVSWIGGKQPFLGWSYVAVSAICVFLAVAGTIKHMVRPRRMGDMSMLSWNQPAK